MSEAQHPHNVPTTDACTISYHALHGRDIVHSTLGRLFWFFPAPVTPNARHHPPPRAIDLYESCRVGGRVHAVVSWRAREFVLRWGPLWLCTMHEDCCWTPPSYSNSNPYNLQRQCRWFPSKPIVVFLARARQAETAIEIAGMLSEDKHVPLEYWQILNGQVGIGYTEHFPDGTIGSLKAKKANLHVQQNHLIRETNRFLTIANGPSFRLYWSRKRGHPVMVQDTGLGFFRLVWLQIAQTLCGGKGIYKCDGCDRYFIAERKPPEGRNHFNGGTTVRPLYQ
jgi:hypothetical protein